MSHPLHHYAHQLINDGFTILPIEGLHHHTDIICERFARLMQLGPDIQHRWSVLEDGKRYGFLWTEKDSAMPPLFVFRKGLVKILHKHQKVIGNEATQFDLLFHTLARLMSVLTETLLELGTELDKMGPRYFLTSLKNVDDTVIKLAAAKEVREKHVDKSMLSILFASPPVQLTAYNGNTVWWDMRDGVLIYVGKQMEKLKGKLQGTPYRVTAGTEDHPVIGIFQVCI